MAGIIGSTSPCVQVVDTHMHYFYNLPPLPGMPQPSPGSNIPFVSRNMYVFKLLITCPGIWTLQDASFTYTNAYGETLPMTMVDFNNSFPLVLPENETIEIEVAWDFYFDGVVGHSAGSLTIIVQYALNYCVSLQTVPYLPPPPPPPPPPGAGAVDPYEGVVSYPLPEDYIPSNDDPGSNTSLPGETNPVGDNNGEAHIPGSDGDVADGAETPSPYDPNGSASPQNTVPNIASADMYRLKKFDVKGKILGDFKDRQSKAGNKPAINKQDKPTTTMPIAGIGEPQELYFTQLNNRSSLPQNSFGPGQSFVPRVKNISAVQNLVYQPNIGQIVGKKNIIKGTTVSDKSVGNNINIKSTLSNPNVDINTKEPHGTNYSVDNFNSYVVKDPKAGSRLEPIPPYHYKEERKLDSKGRPIKSSQSQKDGAAASSPKASFNLFATRIPKDKIQAFISRKSTRQLAQTSGNQNYEVPISNEDFTIVDDSNIIYNGGQGLFYGVGPFETVQADEFLEALYTLNPKKDNIETFVTVNDSSIVESNVVTPASIGIQNNSFHQAEYNVLIILGVLDSEAIFRYIGYNYINILPRSYQFMNAIIPPGLPPGSTKIVGMVFNSNNELILSETEDVIIAPDGYTVEGYTPYSPSIPASLANLANNPAPLHGGRVFEVISKRRYQATSNTIDIISKSPQIAITRGLDSKITAIDISSTGVSSDRYSIDGVEIFVGAHNAYLQFNTTSGNNVDIKISDALNKSHSTYGFNVFASNLDLPNLTFSGIANESGYLGGYIQTNVINGRILLENNRTNISTIVPTTHEGYLVLNTVSGWNQSGEEITQVVSSQTPYLGFNTLPGDTIRLYAEGIGGNYNDLLVEDTLLPDNLLELPLSPYTLPAEVNLPTPIQDPVNQGNTIPMPNPIPDPPPLPGTDSDDPNPLPPPTPGTPLPTNGECVVPSGNEFSWKVKIISTCQRPSNPCIVDIVVDIYTCDEEGNPISSSIYQAEIINELSSFSINSTNGIDGDWYQLNPLSSDSQHSGPNAISIPGTYNFVADMCDHFSTFFSTDKVAFKLVFRIGEQGAGGGFVGNCTIQEILG